MVAVVLRPHNELAVVLGVFESEEKAVEVLLKAGCKYLSLADRYPDTRNPYRGNGGISAQSPRFSLDDWVKRRLRWEETVHKVRLFVTGSFVDHLRALKLPAYSSGASLDEMWVDLEPIALNAISFGYNDD